MSKEERIEMIKKELYEADVVASEVLSDPEYDDLTVEEKSELLVWSGDDEFMYVASDGSVRCKKAS